MKDFNIEVKPQPDGKFKWRVYTPISASPTLWNGDRRDYEIRGVSKTAEAAMVAASKIVSEHVQRKLIEELKKSFNDAAPVSRASV